LAAALIPLLALIINGGRGTDNGTDTGKGTVLTWSTSLLRCARCYRLSASSIG
jgi:hypothetical protein